MADIVCIWWQSWKEQSPDADGATQRGDGLILWALMNTGKVGARGSTGGRERRAPELESVDGILTEEATGWCFCTGGIDCGGELKGMQS